MSTAEVRDPACVERWPDCKPGAYDPRCCRFPKSCSCAWADLPNSSAGAPADAAWADLLLVLYDGDGRITPEVGAALLRYREAVGHAPNEPDLPLPWGEFTVTCKRCGGQRVTLDSSVGFSARSGAWGSVDMVCADCGNEATLWDTL